MLELFGNKYPYTDFHELNLDWLISKVIAMNGKLDNFVSLNTIKYANPIGWDITKQYEVNTVVLDQNTGIAYISNQPVPAGVSISNTGYWSVIFDLQQIIGHINENLTYHNDGTSPTTTFSLNVGDWVLWQGVLYKVLVPMSPGYAYIPDSNIEAHSVEELISEYITTLYAYIGALADLTTSDKTSVVNAINSVLSDLSTIIGSLADLTTSDKTSIVNAINSVLSDLSTIIGSLASLTTSDKTSIVNAINSVLSDLSTIIGDLNLLTTTDKTSIVSAINEVDALISAEASTRAYDDAVLRGFIDARQIAQPYRKYILIFDSYGGLGISTIASSVCSGGYHVINVGGAGFVGNGGGQTWVQAFEAYVSGLTADERAQFTDVMIFGGVNDYAYQVDDIMAAMTNFNNIKTTYVPQCLVTLCPVSWATRLDGTISNYNEHVMPAYSLGASYLQWEFVDGLNAFIHCDAYMQADGIHPTSTGCDRLGNAIADFIKTGVKPKLSTEARVATFTPVSGNASSSAIYTMINDDTVKLAGYIIATFGAGITIPTSAIYSAKIGTLSNSYLQGNVVAQRLPANIVTVPAYVHNLGTNAWELHPVTLQIYYFGVYICIEGPSMTIDAIQTPIFEVESNLNLG